MFIRKIICLFVFLTIVACNNNSKKNTELPPKKHSVSNKYVYAENKKGGYLMLKINGKEDAYLKVKGANYTNHYFGTLTKDDNQIKFYPIKAININGCKSRKYQESVIGIYFGEDEKIFNEMNDYSISYYTSSDINKTPLKLEGLLSHIKIPKSDKATIIFENEKNEFFKSDSISISPLTTMICINSRIRSKVYDFEIREDSTILSKNYFGKPIVYTIKNISNW